MSVCMCILARCMGDTLGYGTRLLASHHAHALFFPSHASKPCRLVSPDSQLRMCLPGLHNQRLGCCPVDETVCGCVCLSSSVECSVLCMETLLKLLRHHVIYKDVFREVGLIEVMVNCLQRYAALLKESDVTSGGRSCNNKMDKWSK